MAESGLCDFCNKSNKEVGPFVEGPGAVEDKGIVRICNTCCDVAEAIFNSNNRKKSSKSKNKIEASNAFSELSPKKILEYLNLHIVGQDTAKKKLSVAVANHYKRLKNFHSKSSEFSDVIIEKSNVLLIGPTGCGKTEIARRIASICNVPFAIADATSITEAGYVGEDVETILLKLLQAADGDVEAAQNGIIFIDEVDKIAGSKGNVSITRDVGGNGVQQALLKIIEGTVANVPPSGGRKHPEQQYIQIDTSNILFICGGTFDGLQEIIARRIGRKTIGFLSELHNNLEDKDNEIMAQALPEDLHEFGMIPEFVGRLPVITHIDQLSIKALEKVLTEPQNAIVKQYQKLFMMDGVKLEFSPEAIKEIAKRAKELKTGARALRGVIEEFISPYMFDLEDMNKEEVFLITAEMVLNSLNKIKKAA